MSEQGWIVPGAYNGNRITLFQWTNQPPRIDGIQASRISIRNGYEYTITTGDRAGDKIIVERGIIIRYEQVNKSN